MGSALGSCTQKLNFIVGLNMLVASHPQKLAFMVNLTVSFCIVPEMQMIFKGGNDTVA